MSVKKFLLRGLETGKISELYNQGCYDDVGIPTNKIKITCNIIKFEKSHSDKSDKPMFILKNKGNSINVATTNTKNYDEYMKNHEFPKEGTCDWCRKEFKYNEKDNKSSGIPVKRITENDAHIYYLDYLMCNDECALAYLYRYKLNHEIIYKNSEQLLKDMHLMRYPDEPDLLEANDFRLHIRNGGTLNDEDFYSKTKSYINTMNIILAPIKREYYEVKK